MAPCPGHMILCRPWPQQGEGFPAEEVSPVDTTAWPVDASVPFVYGPVTFGVPERDGCWCLTVLLIVMFETGTWRLKPEEKFTFGRSSSCTAVMPNADRGVSRNAGSFEWRAGCWWLVNASASSMLYLSGDRGFRADIPPGMALPIQQWHAKVRIDGMLASYTIRVRLPDLDEEIAEAETGEAQGAEGVSKVVPERTVTSTKLRTPLSDSDRLVLRS